MGLYCSICKNVVPDGFSQCLACKAGFAPQLACSVCGKLVQRGAVSCGACARSSREVAVLSGSSTQGSSTQGSSTQGSSTQGSSTQGSSTQGSSTQGSATQGSATQSQALSLPPLPTLMGILVPSVAPPVLPGLPAHVARSAVKEIVSAGRFGVTATVIAPALDVAIMNDMNAVVVIAHTVASRISASFVDTGKARTPAEREAVEGEVMNEMGQLTVILHRLAERINSFQGIAESTRAVIRACRLLATDLQGEIENWKITGIWCPTEANRSLVRQCRVLATELQDEIEMRRGPQG